MSKVNREKVEDQHKDDFNDRKQRSVAASSSDSSKSSLENSESDSSCPRTSTGSNNDVCHNDEAQESFRHMEYRKSNKFKEGHKKSGLDASKSNDASRSQVIDCLQQEATTSIRQNCDIKSDTCPFVAKSGNSAKFECKNNDTIDDNAPVSPSRVHSLLSNIKESELVHEDLNSPKQLVQQDLEQNSLATTTSILKRDDNKSKQQHSQTLSSKNDDSIRGHNYNKTSTTPFGLSYSNISSTTSTKSSCEGNANESSSTSSSSTTTTKRIPKPASSPSHSISILDTNNNNNNKQGALLSNLKRNNFSKSASGSRLMNKSRPNVCDCLTPDCGEKKHSNRRQFIEHYYNSRTQLPSATSTSSFNISTPLNRLSECDAITKRLLSSPIRTINQLESPTRRIQISEVDKSRRASLGTNTITDQVFLFSSNPFKSLELGHNNTVGNKFKYQQQPCSSKANVQQSYQEVQERGHQNDKIQSVIGHSKTGENDTKQQQGRSLSVCDEETFNPRTRGLYSEHSSNLNRAISLASESRSALASRRLLNLIPLFGCDIMSLEQFNRLGLILPPIIDSIVDYILINGVESIGIFRKSGVKSRILTLKQRIEGNQSVRFEELNQNNEFSIYDIADLVKMWFRELRPLPLMTKELIKLISIFLKTSKHQIKNIDPNLGIKINSMTSMTHRALLAKALGLLEQISFRWQTNQMTSQNLAICLTPSLCETESDQNSILTAQKALEFCIENHRKILILD